MHVDVKNTEPTDSGSILSVGGLLNIIYRRRALVIASTALGLIAGIAYGFIVKPLYRSTAQVRPGIVAFTPEGGPLREAALEDIVGWFDKSLYWEDLKTLDAFSSQKVAPVIDAEFVPSLNFAQGGDVITLTNLSRDRETARAVLDRSMAAYNRQAGLDSLGSSLHLTTKAARLRIERLDQDIAKIDAEFERTNLLIDEHRRELSMVEMDRQGVELELQRLAEENIWRRRAVIGLRDEVPGVRARAAEAEKLLALTLQTDHATGGSVAVGQGSGPVSEVLLQTASREQAGRAGELLATVSQLSQMANAGVTRADSLEAVINANEIQMKRLRLVMEIELAKKRADIEQLIRDKQIVLERDQPRERALLQADQRSEQIKLDVVSPLQRVGAIAVSAKPVRPRRLRAASILTFLGFCGGLALALGWEYLDANRAVITAPRRQP